MKKDGYHVFDGDPKQGCYGHDSRESVFFTPTQIDVVRSKRGKPRECVIANGGLRLGAAFPHKAYAIDVRRSRAFVVDKINPKTGAFLHFTRYLINPEAMKALRRFDKTGIWVPVKVHFRPPGGRERIGAKHAPGNSPGGNGAPKKHRSPALSRMQMAVAGLMD